MPGNLKLWNSGLSWLCKFPGSLKCSCESEIPDWDISVVGSPWNQVLCEHGFSITLEICYTHGLAGNQTFAAFCQQNFLKTDNCNKTFLVLISQTGKFLTRCCLDLSVTSALSIEFSSRGQDSNVFWVLDVLLSGFCLFHVLSPTSHIPTPC